MSGRNGKQTWPLIDPAAELVLIVTDEKAYESMTVHLHGIGYDNITGYLCGGMMARIDSGQPISV